jgi:uncharacterized protein (TIRG00374 family)
LSAALTPSVRKWVSISAFLGFAAFLLYLYFFTDIIDVASILGRTNLFFYSLVFLCVLASVVFNALAWQCLLESLKLKTPYSTVFKLSWVGIFVDAIIPGGWSGDAFKAYLLSRDPNIDSGKTVASIVMKNVLELLIILAVSFLGLMLLATNYTLDFGVMATIGTVMVLLTLPLVVIIYLSINFNATKRILRRLKRFYAFVRRQPVNAEEFEKKMEEKLREYHDGMVALKANPKALFQTLSYHAVAWSFDIIALFLIFTSINYPVTADKIIITNTISVNLQTQGIALVGFAQLVSSNVYTILGIPGSYSVASTVLSGFASFWFKVIIAFFTFQIVVFSRCLPPFCIRLSNLRGKSPKDENMLTQNNGDKYSPLQHKRDENLETK